MSGLPEIDLPGGTGPGEDALRMEVPGTRIDALALSSVRMHHGVAYSWHDPHATAR